MNLPSLLSIGAAGVSLLLSIYLLFSGLGNKSQQEDWQKQQQELQTHQQLLGNLQQQAQLQQQQIQSGKQLAEQVGPAVLKDIGTVVLQKDDKELRGLLTKYGVSVSTPAPEVKTPGAATPGPR